MYQDIINNSVELLACDCKGSGAYCLVWDHWLCPRSRMHYGIDSGKAGPNRETDLIQMDVALATEKNVNTHYLKNSVLPHIQLKHQHMAVNSSTQRGRERQKNTACGALRRHLTA